ncbi:MAG: alpha/beta hydrolase [Bacteroidota bacterium]
MRILSLWLCLLLLSACSYLPEKVEPNPQIQITEDPDWIILKPVNRILRQTGLLYIPGGLVDPHAYIPAVQSLVSEQGHVVLIPKVTANLAIFNVQKALDGPALAPEVQDWIIAGHSLGGATACILLGQTPDAFAGLMLTGSYSSVDLSAWDRPVLSLLGELDGVLRQEVFDESLGNLPSELWVDDPTDIPEEGSTGQTIYHEIPGANHAGFGLYGEQSGDNPATISPEEQHRIVNAFFTAFLEANNLDG